MTTDYRFAPHLAARLMGVGLVVLGLVVVGVSLGVGALGWPVWSVVVLFAAGLLAIGGIGYWLTRRAVVVQFGEKGYRVRFVRGVGVGAARWKDVEDAVTTTVAGSPVVVLRLRDGRSTTVPVQVLAVDREQFVRELQDHLQRGHGLRRLN